MTTDAVARQMAAQARTNATILARLEQPKPKQKQEKSQ